MRFKLFWAQAELMNLRTVKAAWMIVSAVLLVAVTPRPAKADIIITLVGSPTLDTANKGYDFTYDVRITGNEEFSNPNSNVTPQYVTLNNIATNQLNVLSATGALKNDFTASWALTSAPSIPVTSASSSGQYNLTFAFTALNTSAPYGGLLQLAIGSFDLGTFTIVSPWIGTTASTYDGQAITTFGPTAGAAVKTVGNVFVPVDPPLAPTTPEPASLTLLGAGLLMLAGLRYRAVRHRLVSRA
jgi:hypothetical protein